ncbi:7844_t:CDS:2 [Diversispora eburnea]|uniref:7844_t:CDS:1 n=1 Tax=Diversispora eburnea TaxID=1213867 RepID=A0A9N9C8X9_9GLOM|nr:7844_t:CDS:2 [Diversispora eburnea]
MTLRSISLTTAPPISLKTALDTPRPRKRIIIKRSSEIVNASRKKTLNENKMKSVGTPTDSPEMTSSGTQTGDDYFISQSYNILYRLKRRQATNYKHRCEQIPQNKGKRMEKISDSLEAFMCYAESFYNQQMAYKTGYRYTAFLNPENYFKDVYKCLKAQPPKLIGMLKYVHATTIKMYYDLEHERCVQHLKEIHADFLKTLKENPSRGAEINMEYNRFDIDFCNEKIYEVFLLCDAAKEFTGNQNLNIDNNLEARAYAQEQLNLWREEKGINFILYITITFASSKIVTNF